VCGPTNLIFLFAASADMKSIPQTNAKTLTIRQAGRLSAATDNHPGGSSTSQQGPTTRALLSEKEVPNLSEFGLWWTLEQRLSEWFASSWKSFEKEADEVAEKFGKLLSKSSSKAADLLDMFELPMSQLPLVLYALKKAKDDDTAAMQILLDEAQRASLEALALKDMTNGVSGSGFLAKVAAKVIDLVNDSPKVRFVEYSFAFMPTLS
jgi:hypothetical protein